MSCAVAAPQALVSKNFCRFFQKAAAFLAKALRRFGRQRRRRDQTFPGQAVIGRGHRVIQVGLFGGELMLPLPIMAIRALTVQGTYVGNPKELRELIKLAQEGSLEALPVATVPRTVWQLMQAVCRKIVRPAATEGSSMAGCCWCATQAAKSAGLST